MKINKITGFMLGNAAHAPENGDKWCDYDTDVYICADLDCAKQILAESHKNTLAPAVVWTTIYRVKANDINCNKIQNNIIWTNQPTKIIVDAPVYYSAPKQITNAEILSKAAHVLPQYSKLINNAYSEENVR